MEVSSIATILRILVLATALLVPVGCERVLELGLSTGDTSDIDAGADTGQPDAGPDGSDGDSETDTETDQADGSTDGSPSDGGAT